jgi:hypothetical protein
VAETLKLPYLNPDDVAPLERSADILQIVIPDYVPELSRSAVILQQVIDYAGILSDSTRHLANLADYAEGLRRATAPLENLGVLIPQLQAVAEAFHGRARTRSCGGLEYLVDLLVEDVVAAVDAVGVDGELDRDAVAGSGGDLGGVSSCVQPQ